MTTAITLKDITIHPVVEQQGPFFDVMEFFPTLTKELLEENRSWLQPTFIDPVSGRLVLCVQSFIIKTPPHNILIDSCVGNHKPRPARPFWNMMNSDRFEKGLAAAGLTVNDIDYVMCTHPRSGRTAYRSAANETFLTQNGFVSHIHRKKPKGRAMHETTRRANNAKSKIRARVEHVFAEQKHRMGLFIRTIGIARATTKIGVANLVYNIKRLVFLRNLAIA